MDLKKGLTMTALGFLFTLVNFNLTLNGGTVNLMPDFIGWIFFVIAVGKLGSYTEGKKYLRSLAFVMATFSTVLWVLSVARPEYDVSVPNTVANILSTVFVFVLFGCLEELARDFESPRESSLKTLRILTLIVNAAFIATLPLYRMIGMQSFALIFTVIGAAALVTAIATLIVVFRLKKDVFERIEGQRTPDAEEQ